MARIGPEDTPDTVEGSAQEEETTTASKAIKDRDETVGDVEEDTTQVEDKDETVGDVEGGDGGDSGPTGGGGAGIGDEPSGGGGIGGGGTDTDPEPEPEPDPDPEPEPETEPEPDDGTDMDTGEPADGSPTEPKDPVSPPPETEPEPETPEPEQGVESTIHDAEMFTDDPQSITGQATQFEQDVLSQYDELEREDVRIVEVDGTLKAELTSTGQEALTAANLGLEEEDIAITDDGVEPVTESGEAVFSMRAIEQDLRQQYEDIESLSIEREEAGVFEVEVETPEGTERFVTGERAEGFLEEQREQFEQEREAAREQAESELEAELEKKAGELRADAAQPISGTVGRALDEGIDLERGEDFEITETAEGISAELTQDYKRELQELQGERQLETFFQTDLDPSDVRLSDEGVPELTESGQDVIAETGTVPVEQERVSGAVRGIRETIPFLEDEGEGGPAIERVPADEMLSDYEKEAEGLEERPAMATRRREAAGMDAVEMDIDDSTLTGEINIPLPDEPREAQGALASRRRELRGEEALTREPPEADTLGEFLGESADEIAESISEYELGADEAPTGLGPGPRGQMTTEPFDRDSGVREFTSSALKATPSLIAQAPFRVPQFALGTAEVTGKAGVAAASGELDEFGSEVKTAALGTGVRAAEAGLEEPFQTGGAVAGSLIGTGAVMGGARAVSGTANLATRAAIQPGEELLGRTGAAVVPGRAGRVLFPRGEPLFASEEAAIAIGSRAYRGLRSRQPFIPNVELEYGTEVETEGPMPRVPDQRALATGEGGTMQARIAELRAKARQFGPDDTRGQANLIPNLETETEVEQETVELEDLIDTEAEQVSDLDAETRLEQERAQRNLQQELNRIKRGEEAQVEVEGVQEGFVAPERGGGFTARERGSGRTAQTPRQIGAGPRGPQQSAFRANLESEAEQRRQQAAEQEAQVGGEMERGIDEELGTAAETKAMSEQAQAAEVAEFEQDFLTEVETLPGVEITTATRSDVDVRSDTDVFSRTEARGLTEADTDVLTETEIGTETRAGLESELRTESELETELERELELETEQETLLETEFETETEVEQELELETEFEFESELEQETEVEAMRPQDQRMRREDAGVFGKVDTDVFKNIDQDLQDLAEEF